MQRTGGALEMTGCARDRTGGTLQRTAGALDRIGVVLHRTGVTLQRNDGALDIQEWHCRGLLLHYRGLAVH